mmetsp:Transcript_84661/g.243036  ORF Transcript_84661/g.243036 Transcript_84661/m.243036 type:complete len:215 (-) Transcript_84661:337-981(-)
MDVTLQVIDVTLRHRGVAQGRVDVLQTLQLLIALPLDSNEGLAVLRDFVSQHPQHGLGAGPAVGLRSFPHLSQPGRALDIELLHLLQLIPLLLELLHEPGLLLLLLAQHGGHLQQHREALILCGPLFQVLDLLGELLALSVELDDLALQVRGVHAAGALLLHVRVRCLKLRLQLLVRLEDLIHLLLAEKFLRNVQVQAELRQVRALLQLFQVAE